MLEIEHMLVFGGKFLSVESKCFLIGLLISIGVFFMKVKSLCF